MNPNSLDALRAPGPFSMRTSTDPFQPPTAPNPEWSHRPHAASHSGRDLPGDEAEETDDTLTHLVARLTPRRLEVLEYVARGLTNREIASVMGISANTVKAHVTGVLETLELTNRTEAAIALQAYEAVLSTAGR